MGSEGAVAILYKRELDKDSKKAPELVQEYKDRFANPYQAASCGYLDDVVQPEEARDRIARSLQMLANKRDKNPPKKHGNIPL
jgi:propionyl-CoA carboxylase beta chain